MAARKQALVNGRDEELEREVKKTFQNSNFKEIPVAVKNGVVLLTSTSATRCAAEQNGGKRNNTRF
jgi:hypothetical protein